MSQPSITCPRCERESSHPKDIEHGYCGNCHDFTFGVTQGKPAEGIIVNGIVAHRNKQPYVQLATTRGLVTQMSIPQARKVAMDILTLAYRTEMDAMLIKFMEDRLGAPIQTAYDAMMLFRDFRHEADMEKIEGFEVDPRGETNQ